MTTKNFLTYNKQIELLEKDKHLLIPDYDFATKTLQKIGYFSLINVYKDLFKHKPSGNYIYKFCKHVRIPITPIHSYSS